MTASDTGTRRRGGDEQTPASPRLPVSGFDETTHGAARLVEPSSIAPTLAARDGARLSKLLAAKSLAETLFVVALAVLFSYSHFSPGFRGSLDVADEQRVAGWVVNESEPDVQIEVELYIDDHFVARQRADESRPDVLAAGRARSAEHGFAFETPPLPPRVDEYEARVFAVYAGADRERRALQQVGDPARFKVQPSEKNSRVAASWWEELEKR